MTDLGWTDNVDGSGTVTGVDGALVGDNCGGTITRTWTYTDGCSNIGTATQIITIDDTTDPTITCSADISQNITGVNCDVIINYVAPIVSDNCSVASTIQTTGLASGAAFPIGTTTNTFVVTDVAGNTNTCSFDVTVTKDNNIALVDVTGTTTPETDGGIVNGTHCPDLNGLQAVIAPSGNTYSAGTSQVQFRVDRLCDTGAWSFAYQIDGAIVDKLVLTTDAGTPINTAGVISVPTETNYILFTIDVDNVIDTALSIDFTVSDGGLNSAIKDDITTQHNLKIIPLIGGFE